MSVQNLVPRADRRLLCVLIGVVVTVLALGVSIDDYSGFLTLIGSVFVPLLGVGVGDALARRTGAPRDLGRWARSRPSMLLAWVIGLAEYQLVNPGGVPGWTDAWTALREAIGFVPPSWLSASLTSFVVAGLVAAGLALVERRRA